MHVVGTPTKYRAGVFFQIKHALFSINFVVIKIMAESGGLMEIEEKGLGSSLSSLLARLDQGL